MSESEIFCVDCETLIKKPNLKYRGGWRCSACARLWDEKHGIEKKSVLGGLFG